MIDELHHTFATEPFEQFVGALHRRVQHLGVGIVDGSVIGKSDAEALMARVVDLVRDRVLGALDQRPGDALRVLDVLRNVGQHALEPARAGCEAARARLHPPPAAVTWHELAELRALADLHPAHCVLGPPASHVEFAARLAAEGTELPGELLAMYAAFSHVALACRHVAAPAGSIGPGESLRVRDGRVILFERVRRHPRMLFVEQPGMSIAPAGGTWWLVLEDERAPATRRPLDLQRWLQFALRRMAAPTLEVLLTELAWRQFFA